MPTFIAAPHPTPKVTMVLPAAEFLDVRRPESNIQVKRSMLGRVITYVRSVSTQQLELRFLITRTKDLELDQFVQVYHTATWKLTLHDSTVWTAKLIGAPIRHQADGRIDLDNPRTGDELVSVVLTFSATKVN